MSRTIGRLDRKLRGYPKTLGVFELEGGGVSVQLPDNPVATDDYACLEDLLDSMDREWHFAPCE